MSRETPTTSATTPTCHLGPGLAAVGRPGYIGLGREQDLPPVRSVDALRARTHELLDAARRCPRRRAHGDRQGGHGQRAAGRPRVPDPLKAVAARTSLGCDAVALAAILRKPWAGVVLSGAATTEQLASGLHAAAVDLDEDQLARLEALAEDPRVYWERRGRLPWH